MVGRRSSASEGPDFVEELPLDLVPFDGTVGPEQIAGVSPIAIFAVDRGDQHDLDLGSTRLPPDRFTHLGARQIGQAHVNQHQPRPMLDHVRHDLATRRYRGDVKPRSAEQLAHQLPRGFPFDRHHHSTGCRWRGRGGCRRSCRYGKRLKRDPQTAPAPGADHHGLIGERRQPERHARSALHADDVHRFSSIGLTRETRAGRDTGMARDVDTLDHPRQSHLVVWRQHGI